MSDPDRRILLIGNDGSGPDPGSGAGACIARTGRFSKALELGGFSVEVISPGKQLRSIGTVRRALNSEPWPCVVAISPYPAELAVLAGVKSPIWIDMNGMHPAEVHLSADEPDGPRREMLRMLSMENTLLSRGDHFSAPSGRQACAIMGELYVLGRLDAADRLALPVSAIPHCALDAPISTGPADPGGTFPVISTGSFNAWFDSPTLFHGLEYAMERNDSISFTSTGGSVPFAEDQYRVFGELSSASRFSSRFRLAGWVSEEELEAIQSGAGAAVYTDIRCGESLLGARTRVLDWISRGIPVVCTEGAEISGTVRDRDLGITVPQGDPEALGIALLELATSPGKVSGIREAQEEWRSGDGSMASMFEPLLDWCRNPARLSTGHLCRPTVAQVSSPGYRSAVLREVSRRKGKGSAVSFLFRSIAAKLRRRSD